MLLCFRGIGQRKRQLSREERNAALLIGGRKSGAAVAKATDNTAAVTEIAGVAIGE